MRLLLDEDVPVPLIEILRHIVRGHEVDHVSRIGWSGKKDVNLYRDARQRGYEAVVTNNIRQLNDPDECDAIKASGLHVVFYEMGDGLDGLALGAAAICAAVRPVVNDLSNRDRQHVVRIVGVAARAKRYTIVDPVHTPPSPYWR